ncbi:MAG: hypothetical protein E7L01_02215 [Paenibacillus macerans]|uniref:Uncharacterized protein n=1 Tax=Paenibacillus macerans TaxID=44252 RepID=A0A091A7P4_PAEMA|nr:hypothetical protein [Paenibacillus macerans]KFN12261.1 hypothetical protein DJ90_2032 [Paenibacillus macerans]MCY7558474.1 hypothetical protein [Paenibacillus macerans]MDU7472165.1 hypothetical protein [Paenibacillus macerans]MEC0150240.1 hypothetical protein [Paenibacillus macerans]MEC0331981.1 hypothetical protein [Paenibacillus macerans]
MLLPILMLLLCLFGGGAAFFFLRHGKRRSKETADLAVQTAQQFVNVRDIHGHFLYTKDSYLLCYLRIFPISLDLLSLTEKRLLIRKLTAELSSIRFPFKFLAVSRPVDISPLINDLSSLLPAADATQKELLRHEVLEMNALALSGEVVERQFYLAIWQKQDTGGERELLEKAKRLVQHFEDAQVQAHLLKQQEIVRLCNLVNNPSYTHLDLDEPENAIPFLVRKEA